MKTKLLENVHLDLLRALKEAEEELKLHVRGTLGWHEVRGRCVGLQTAIYILGERLK